jgi:transposase
LGAHGHSKDHRPDLKQMVLAVILDGAGEPLCCELWPGNTTDVKTLVPVADRLQARFGITQVCIVADRGMISRETLAALEARQWQYILGARMRVENEVRREVVAKLLPTDTSGPRPGFMEVQPERRKKKDPSPLQVREVCVGAHRYVACYNPEQARKDAYDRHAIIASLREQLKHGDKSLVGNKGYRKYLKANGSRYEIDEARAKADATYDGLWVLRTNTQLSAVEVALHYKQLWRVERIFRDSKTLLKTRPIFHKYDETIRGHVFCSFLALVLLKALDRHLEEAGVEAEWNDLLRDLKALQLMRVEDQGKAITLRSQCQGC